MTPPLALNTFSNAVAFSVYAACMRNMAQPTSITQSMMQNLGAGCAAGLVNSVLITPFDLIKCRLQVTTYDLPQARIWCLTPLPFPLSVAPQGPIHCAATIVRSAGLGGLYQGYGATVVREIPGFGVYFGSYQVMKDMLVEREVTDFQSSVLAGGVSGALSWLVVYPIDYVKSVLQVRPSSCPTVGEGGGSSIGILKHSFQKHGLRRMFKGVGTTLVRAFVVNGTLFPIHEAALSLLLKSNEDNSAIFARPKQLHLE
ncbi:unnamed protein product [Chrysoparadoxa australica]